MKPGDLLRKHFGSDTFRPEHMERTERPGCNHKKAAKTKIACTWAESRYRPTRHGFGRLMVVWTVNFVLVECRSGLACTNDVNTLEKSVESKAWNPAASRSKLSLLFPQPVTSRAETAGNTQRVTAGVQGGRSGRYVFCLAMAFVFANIFDHPDDTRE